MKERRELSQFSSSELIAMAKKSAQNGELGMATFKEVNNVDFSFMQLCSRLNKRKIMGRRVLNNFEYSKLKEGCIKAEIVNIFIDVMIRYENGLFEQRDEI